MCPDSAFSSKAWEPDSQFVATIKEEVCGDLSKHYQVQKNNTKQHFVSPYLFKAT